MNDHKETLLKVMEVLGGEEAVLNLPVLDLKGRKGTTGYIDFLRPEDVTAPIMSGVDVHDRPFFALRLECDWLDAAENDRLEVYVETIFQRYANDFRLWTSGTRSIARLSNGELNLDLLKELIEVGSITVKDWGEMEVTLRLI